MLPKCGIFFNDMTMNSDTMNDIEGEMIILNSSMPIKYSRLDLKNTTRNKTCIKYIPNEHLEIVVINLLKLLHCMSFKHMKINRAVIGRRQKSYQI